MQLVKQMGAICDHYVRYFKNNYERNDRVHNNKCTNIEVGKNTPLKVCQREIENNKKNNVGFY